MRKDISSFAFTGLHKRNGAEIRNLCRLAPYLQVLMPSVAQSQVAGDVMNGRWERLQFEGRGGVGRRF